MDALTAQLANNRMPYVDNPWYLRGENKKQYFRADFAHETVFIGNEGLGMLFHLWVYPNTKGAFEVRHYRFVFPDYSCLRDAAQVLTTLGL